MKRRVKKSTETTLKNQTKQVLKNTASLYQLVKQKKNQAKVFKHILAHSLKFIK